MPRSSSNLKRLATALALAASLLSVSSARADIALWYNGDDDGRDSITNGTKLSVGNWLVYDDFVVPTGQTWSVHTVFSTDLMNYSATHATWEIHSGVSTGNGGTLVASGDGAATQTLLSSGSPYNEYTISESIPTVTLTAGRNWLAVAPDLPSFGNNLYSFVVTTSGKNAVGNPPGNNGNSFVTNNLTSPLNLNFTPTTDPSLEGPGTWDYSMGVSGVLLVSVPEPSAVPLAVVTGLGAVALVFRRPIFKRAA